MQGALKNVGHCVGRSTIRRILKAAGLPPVPLRPTSWQTFLKAHWGVIAAADVFTTEVWTWRGLVTYYTVFVIDIASRRVHVLGSRPHPSDLGNGAAWCDDSWGTPVSAWSSHRRAPPTRMRMPSDSFGQLRKSVSTE